MIDNLTQLLSTLLILVVAIQAMRVDRIRPWFARPEKPDVDTRAKSAQSGRTATRRPAPSPNSTRRQPR